MEIRKKVKKFRKNLPIKTRRVLNQIGLRKRKVFAIGFNKSGTVSLHALFESLGRPSYHDTDWMDCENLKLLQSYDCFSDGHPKNIERLDKLFPRSKFILQVRELDTWIYSRLAHIERHEERCERNKLNPTWIYSEGAVKKWIERRNAHHLFVLSYFSRRPEDLCVVNFIRDEHAATKVANFLGYEGDWKRPKRNVNASKREVNPEYFQMLQDSISELGISEAELKYDLYCPSLESAETRAKFPLDTSMLAANASLVS